MYYVLIQLTFWVIQKIYIYVTLEGGPAIVPWRCHWSQGPLRKATMWLGPGTETRAQSQCPPSQTNGLWDAFSLNLWGFRAVTLSNQQVLQLSRSHFEGFMHPFRKSAFLQTLPREIAYNSQRCDVKHQGYQWKPRSDRKKSWQIQLIKQERRRMVNKQACKVQWHG